MTQVLLVIDVQLGMFDSPRIPSVSNGDRLLHNVRTLIERARQAAVPVMYVQHNGTPGHPVEKGTPHWRIHPDIAPEPDDLRFQKTTPDAFMGTMLQAELARRGVQKLVICGIQTEFCVDTTTRRAASMGYDVTLISDAHSTWDTDSLTAQQIIDHHNYCLRSWFATLTTTAKVRLSSE